MSRKTMPEVKQDAPAVKEGEENTKKAGEGDTQKPEETLETLIPKEESEESKAEKIAQDQRKRAEKSERQVAELQAEIAKLKTASMTGSMPILEVGAELKKLAEEHNIDESFLAKLVSTVKAASASEIKAELEKDYNPKLAKIERERQMEQSEKKFEELYSKTLKGMPEYEGITNKEVIKALAFNPANAKKTLPQIIEEAYGGALQGRKSIETAHIGREPEAPNVVNPTKEDWEKIESDPKAKESWAKEAERQIRDYL